MDGDIELICGSFSSDPQKSKITGEQLHLPPQRVYDDYEQMILKEGKLPEDVRMDFVSIVTPNHVHFEPAKLALENGFHVVLDKPMTISLAQAKELKAVVERSGKYFCLTHTYTGYPMVKQAREHVRSGKVGVVKKIFVAYPQGWLTFPKELTDNKQAAWRHDPVRSGLAGCMGDIGTHAFNMAEYVTGLKLSQICADLNTVVEGRKLDDDGSVLLKFDNGATGVLIASQIMAGEENDFTIKVYGDIGGLEWRHSDPNTLLIKSVDRPEEKWRAGTPYLSDIAKHNVRTPAGHPEGYIEAFANHYRNFTLCVYAQMAGEKPKEEWFDFPGAEDGVRGMAFIENVVASAKSNEKWTTFAL
jgi:predicted dehydrogenase